MNNKNIQNKQKEFKDNLYKNYNMGWAHFLMRVIKEKNYMDKPAIFYRGNIITFSEMFNEAYRFAASMREMGICKGMEIPMCLSNCPETIYTLLAASLIGAKINVFGHFDKDYIEEIINGTDAKVLFVTDDQYDYLHEILPNTNVDKVVMYSLSDSYPYQGNPYFELEKNFYDGQNKLENYKAVNENILNKNEFVSLGRGYEGTIDEESTLDDVFSITYSSGSTNAHRPKAIKHRVRSFNAMGVAHNGGDTPKMKDIRTLVQIPTHSNTCLISSISDTLSQGCTCALEYIYDEFFFPMSLQINKPALAEATRTFWIRCFKEYNNNPAYENVDLKFLLAPFAVGEPTSKGEEEYFNKNLRHYKAGTNFTKTPFSVISMSMGGGDCEHGGIFINIFKALSEKNPNRFLTPEPKGYTTYKMVDYVVLNKNKDHCKPYEYGTLVADSLCNMVGYKNNEEATNEFFVKDSNGKTYGNCNTYSYIDFKNEIHIKGRIPDVENSFPLFLIQDEVCEISDVLSCEVIEESGKIVVHVEKKPYKNISDEHFLFAIQSRLHEYLPENIYDNVVFVIRDFNTSFPSTNCGKRSAEKLKQEGIKNAVRLIPVSLGNFEMLSAEEYFNDDEFSKIISLNKQS